MQAPVTSAAPALPCSLQSSHCRHAVPPKGLGRAHFSLGRHQKYQSQGSHPSGPNLTTSRLLHHAEHCPNTFNSY